MFLAVIAVLLGVGAALAAAGYVRSAYDELGSRALMPELLSAFALAVGFLGLLLK